MSQTNPADQAPTITGEPRQLLFLALCSLALVLAAFAAPPTAQGASPPDLPLGDWFGNESQAPGECTVMLSDDPVPGQEVTVTVRRGTAPVQDVRVWFNDRSVGVTDESGRVAGTVPYVRELDVTVALPGGGSCEFDTGTAGGAGARQAGTVDARTHQASVAGPGPQPTLGPGQPAPQAGDEVNVSDSFPITSAISVDVVGEPNPGENVTLVATIEDDPVPDATVSVDGERVGRTDGAGEYTLTIPDDGRERLRIDVQRGEITGRTFVDVRLLRVAVDGARFPLPGQSATVRAAIGTDAVEGAEVSLAGERVGTTDALGQAEIVLPSNPLATVTVTTGDRTASTSILAVYATTIVAACGVLLLVVGVPLTLYWAGGRRAVAVLVGLAANLVTAAAGYAVAGHDGALLAVGSALLLCALVVFLRRPQLATGAGERTGRVLGSLSDQVVDGVLTITRGVEVLLDQTQTSIAGALDSLRRFELAALAADVQSWLLAIPGWVGGGVLAVLRAPRRLVAWLRRRSASEETGPRDREPRPEPAPGAPGPAIRELWRRFARRVVPDRWPQRTPGEVSRRAIEAGFPRESVVELTAVFRDVEYGGESLSDDHFRRARTAFQSLDSGGRDDATTVEDGDDAGDGRGDGEVNGS